MVGQIGVAALYPVVKVLKIAQELAKAIIAVKLSMKVKLVTYLVV